MSLVIEPFPQARKSLNCGTTDRPPTRPTSPGPRERLLTPGGGLSRFLLYPHSRYCPQAKFSNRTFCPGLKFVTHTIRPQKSPSSPPTIVINCPFRLHPPSSTWVSRSGSLANVWVYLIRQMQKIDFPICPGSIEDRKGYGGGVLCLPMVQCSGPHNTTRVASPRTRAADHENRMRGAGLKTPSVPLLPNQMARRPSIPPTSMPHSTSPCRCKHHPDHALQGSPRSHNPIRPPPPAYRPHRLPVRINSCSKTSSRGFFPLRQW